jgi:hypothetical protein
MFIVNLRGTYMLSYEKHFTIFSDWIFHQYMEREEWIDDIFLWT